MRLSGAPQSRDDVEFALQELSEAEQGEHGSADERGGLGQGKLSTSGLQRFRSRMGVTGSLRRLHEKLRTV